MPNAALAYSIAEFVAACGAKRGLYSPSNATDFIGLIMNGYPALKIMLIRPRRGLTSATANLFEQGKV